MEVPANGSIPLTWNMQSSSEPLRMMDYAKPDGFKLELPQLLAWGLNSYAPMMCIFGLLAFLKTYFGKLQSLLEDHFTSTLHVKATDETYDMLLAWGSSRGLDNSARSIIARVGAKWKPRDHLSENGKKPICFSPWNGTFLFRFKGQFLSYQTQTLSAGLHKEEVITITCLGRSVQVLKDLIEECRDEYLKQNQNKMAVFKHCGDYWQKTTTKDKRPLSTVITDEAQKQELVDDVKDFLDPRTQDWYAKRSIPYRRGYLLHGPPGTGKSSLASAVAAEFDLDIRAISIPGVDDQKLEGLFNALPERCLVLLEDIDAVGADRSHDTGVPGKNKKTLSLSGLLNTLDGVASQEGRVVIMTTNHIEKLDEALIRPGRIDKKIEITLADSSVIAQLFRFVFGPNTKDCPSTEEELMDTDQLGAEFATKIPALEFSTAQIMSYLLQHKDCPKIAVQGATNWVERERGEAQTKSRKMVSKLPVTELLDEGLWMKSDKKGQKKDNLKKTNLQITPPPSPSDDVRNLCRTPTPAPSSTEKVAFHLSKSCNKNLCHLAAAVEPASEDHCPPLFQPVPEDGKTEMASGNKTSDNVIEKVSIHKGSTSLDVLGDRTEAYGGMDVNHCLPPWIESISGDDTGMMSAKSMAQCNGKDMNRKTLLPVPLRAVGAPMVAEDYASSSAKPNIQVELIAEVEKPHVKSESEDADVSDDTDIYFPLNLSSRKMTREDYNRLGNQGWWKEIFSDANVGLPPMSKESLELENRRAGSASADGNTHRAPVLTTHTADSGIGTETAVRTGTATGESDVNAKGEPSQVAVANTSIQQRFKYSDVTTGLPPMTEEAWRELRISSGGRTSTSGEGDTGIMTAKNSTPTGHPWPFAANASSLQEMKLDRRYTLLEPLQPDAGQHEEAEGAKCVDEYDDAGEPGWVKVNPLLAPGEMLEWTGSSTGKEESAGRGEEEYTGLSPSHSPHN